MTARKARESDLGQAMPPVDAERPRWNGDGHEVIEIGPQVAEPRVSSPFPPIAEYAFLSDCEVNCLIAPSGRVEWMCLPRPDSPSVFAAMLDRAAGSFRFGPSGVQVRAGRARHQGAPPGRTRLRRDGLAAVAPFHGQGILG